MNNSVNDNDVIEIDLREIFYALRKWIVVICLTCVLGGVLAFAYTKFLVTPMYTAENSMLTLSKETTLSSLADLQMGSQLTNDYKVLATSRPVLEAVIEDLNLDMTYNQLNRAITVTNPTNTRILMLSIEHESPKMALDIIRAVANEASAYIGDMMEVVPPKIIDEGVIPLAPTSPSTMKNTFIGILLGAVLSCGIVVLRVVLDDTLKSEEDIEKHLGISTLSVVPDRKDFINNQSKDKASKKLFGKNDR